MLHHWKRVSLSSAVFTLGVLGYGGAQSQDVPASASPPAATPASVAAGQRTYDQFCAGCHGPAGKGNGHGGESGPKPADLTAEKLAHGSTDQEIFKVIKNGVPPNYYMVPWEGQISDEDIWNVVHYVRTLRSRP